MFGYASNDGATCTPDSTVGTTKYRTLSRSLHLVLHYEHWEGYPLAKTEAWDYTAHMDLTTTVGQTTGVITVPTGGCHSYITRENKLGTPITPGTDNFCNDPTLAALTGLTACDNEIVGWEGKNAEDTVDIAGTTFTIDSIEITNTSIDVELSFEVEPVSGGMVVNGGELTISFELSDAYTSATVDAEVTALLAWWDLADDATYPWRRDRYTTVAPLVTYDEVPTAVSPAITWSTSESEETTCTYVDGNAGYYTGAILGKPFEDGYPEARLSGQSQTEYISGAIADTPYTLTYAGATLTSVRRLIWNEVTEEYEEGFDDEGGDYYTFTKDAYGIGTITLPSGTWNPLVCAQPVEEEGEAVGSCSGDHPDLLEVVYSFYWMLGGHFDHRHTNYRWLGAGPTEYRYSGAWSGGSGTIDPSDAAMPRTATQWTDAVAAAQFPHGAWSIMLHGNAFMPDGVLWKQKYAEIKLPWRSQNWFGPCGSDRDLEEYPDAWPIEGDRGCTFSEDSGTVTVTLDSAAEYLRVGDLVDFTSADGLTVDDNSTAGYEVLSVDTSSFTYSGSAPASSYTRVKSHGAPGFWWYDTDGKGSYSVVRHTFDYRTTTDDPGTMEEIERGCLSFDRCWPAVMCFSPNYDEEDEDTIDAFEHGDTYSFGEMIMDQRYGGRWQGFFVQAMVDLWWVQPDTDGLTEDGGTCTEDGGGTTYWPHRPWVECLEVRPDNWYVAGADFAPDYEEHTEEPEYKALVAVGPTEHISVPTETAEILTPWVTWLAMQTCICAEGRWAEDGVTTTPAGYHYRGYENILGTWMCGAETS